MALRAVLNPGDEVIYHEPCYVSYAPSVLLAHAVPVPVSCRPEDGFSVSASAIEAAIADLKSSLENGDAEQVKEKTNALSQAAMKLGEAMYKAQAGQAEADAARDAGASQGGADDVVDAD